MKLKYFHCARKKNNKRNTIKNIYKISKLFLTRKRTLVEKIL